MFGIFKWYFYDNIFSLAVLWWRVFIYVYTSVARISFYLLRHSIMLRWSYIIHLPLVWRQRTNTHTQHKQVSLLNNYFGLYIILLFCASSFSIYSPNINIRRLPLWMPSQWPIVYRPPQPTPPPPLPLLPLPFFRISDIWFLSMHSNRGGWWWNNQYSQPISNSTQFCSCWNLIFGWTRYHQIIFWMKNAIRIWIMTFLMPLSLNRHSICEKK